jgi:uncharacterized protein (TIGR03437 family)
VSTSVSAVSGGNWLSVGPLTGNSLTLTATPGSLGPGSYQAQVRITPTGASVPTGQTPTTYTVNAFLQVLGTGQTGQTGTMGGGAAAFVRPASANFRMVQGGANPEPRILNVSSPTGGASFSWSASRTINTPPAGNWFQISPAAGAGAGIITITVNGTGLAPGTYNGEITVTSGTSSVKVPVTLQVRATGGAGGGPAGGPQGGQGGPQTQGEGAGPLNINPRAFNFIKVGDGPVSAPKTLRIASTTSSPVSWTASKSAAWIMLSKTSGTTPDTLNISVDVTGLSSGHHEGYVEVTGGGSTLRARVWARLVGMGAGPGGVTPTGGTRTGRETPSAVQITPRVIEFSSTGGVTTPGSVPVQISSTVTGLSFAATRTTARGGNWLNLSANAGAIPGGFTVTANPVGLASGHYTGIVAVNITGAVAEQRLIQVSLRVSTPGESLARLNVRPGSVAFRATRGGANPAPAQVTVEAAGAASIAYQATVSTMTGGNWLSVNPTAGTATGTVNVSANITGLAAGRYNGAVVFQATGSPGALPATLNVVLNVTAPPSGNALTEDGAAAYGIFLEPAAEFLATAYTARTVRVQLFQNDGRPAEGLQMTVAPSGEESPFLLQELGGGVYEGVFQSLGSGPLALAATATNDAGEAVALFALGGDLEGVERPLPLIFPQGVVSAANFAPGITPVSAGSILSLFGINLTETTQFAASLPLPRELGGVQVLIGGVAAPLISVVADSGAGFDQINFQLPVEVSSLHYADIVVVSNGVFSSPEGLSLAPAVPGIFTQNQQGIGLAAATRPDFSIISAERPVRSGDTIVLFATGLGAVAPAVRTGQAPAEISRVTGQVQVLIGGLPAQAGFAGLAPGFVGLYQVNVVVPEGVAPGEASLEIRVDGIRSSFGVTIPIG